MRRFIDIHNNPANQWRFNRWLDATGGQRKTPGRLAYEADCALRPNYHDGTPRRHWDELGDVLQRNWEKSE